MVIRLISTIKNIKIFNKNKTIEFFLKIFLLTISLLNKIVSKLPLFFMKRLSHTCSYMYGFLEGWHLAIYSVAIYVHENELN
jgi:hypothetical protein